MTMTVSNAIKRRPVAWAMLVVALTGVGCGSSSPPETRSVPPIEDELVHDAERLMESLALDRADHVAEATSPAVDPPRLQRDPFGRLARTTDRAKQWDRKAAYPIELNGPAGLVSLQAIMTFSDRSVAMIDGRAIYVGEQLAAGGRTWTLASIDQDGRSVTLEAADDGQTYVATVNVDSM